MNKINQSRVRSESVKLEKCLDELLSKYGTDEFEVKPEELSEADFSLYIALDSVIEMFNEIAREVGDTLIVNNTAATRNKESAA